MVDLFTVWHYEGRFLGGQCGEVHVKWTFFSCWLGMAGYLSSFAPASVQPFLFPYTAWRRSRYLVLYTSVIKLVTRQIYNFIVQVSFHLLNSHPPEVMA